MQNREKVNKRRSELYDERNEASLCSYCGQRPNRDKKRSCEECGKERSDTQGKFSRERKDRQALYRKRIRRDAIDKYGGKCACCGEIELLFLTLDHINDDGSKERLTKGGTGTSFYMKVLREELRTDLRVLCYNCNMGRAVGGGICPHLRPTREILNQEEDLRKFRRMNIGCKASWPSDEDLLKEYKEFGSRVIAERLGVTQSAVTKRMDRRALPWRNSREKVSESKP